MLVCDYEFGTEVPEEVNKVEALLESMNAEWFRTGSRVYSLSSVTDKSDFDIVTRRKAKWDGDNYIDEGSVTLNKLMGSTCDCEYELDGRKFETYRLGNCNVIHCTDIGNDFFRRFLVATRICKEFGCPTDKALRKKMFGGILYGEDWTSSRINQIKNDPKPKPAIADSLEKRVNHLEEVIDDCIRYDEYGTPNIRGEKTLA